MDEGRIACIYRRNFCPPCVASNAAAAAVGQDLRQPLHGVCRVAEVQVQLKMKPGALSFEKDQAGPGR
jgi:hypothetical protein